ncbi:helix-turn-helix transcriptional regulator [Rhizobium leguminosarum]
MLLSLPRPEGAADISENNYFGLIFEKAAMLRQVNELLEAPATQDVEFETMIDLTTADGARLGALGNFVWNCVATADLRQFPQVAVERLFQAVMIALLVTVPNNYMQKLQGPASPAVPWRVKRAIEYMHANLSQPMTVASIARVVGTSVRALQCGFHEFKDTTPLGYLRTIRLAAARKALLCNPNALSIGEIARNSGFNHLGRFAAAYCQAFGESPSTTASFGGESLRY